MNSKLKIILLSVVLLLSSVMLFAQESKRNNNWAIGYESVVKVNFNNGVNVTKVLNPNIVPFYCIVSNATSSISDSNGNFLFFEEGHNIYDIDGYMMKNGRNINCPYGDTLLASQGASNFDQTSIILPKKGNEYYVFSTGMSDSVFMNYFTKVWTEFDVLNYSVVNMDSNAGKGKVIVKNKILTENQHYTNPALTAVRHGNGKDWWLMKADCVNNRYQFFLVKQDTIIGPTYQTLSANAQGVYCDYIYSQNYFSDDGTKMISSMYLLDTGITAFNANRVDLYDFNRCSGVLTFKNYYVIPFDTVNYPNKDYKSAVQFSPNGNLAYVSNLYTIYQINLEDTNRYNAILISGPDTNITYFPWYATMANAPDGKLYIGNFNGTRNKMSYIANPNVKGLGCNFVAQGFSQNFNQNLLCPPNMPNYGLLGADSSNNCYPLSLLNPPKEDFDNWSVYPNPASSKIYIKIASQSFAMTKKELYNSVGQLIISTKENEIYVGNLPKGIYFLKCEGITKKVIVE